MTDFVTSIESRIEKGLPLSINQRDAYVSYRQKTDKSFVYDGEVYQPGSTRIPNIIISIKSQISERRPLSPKQVKIYEKYINDNDPKYTDTHMYFYDGPKTTDNSQKKIRQTFIDRIDNTYITKGAPITEKQKYMYVKFKKLNGFPDFEYTGPILSKSDKRQMDLQFIDDMSKKRVLTIPQLKKYVILQHKYNDPNWKYSRGISRDASTDDILSVSEFVVDVNKYL